MGKLLKKLFYALLICSFLYTCVYHQVTHLSSDELEWVTNRKVGEIMYFKSQFGEVDTVEIFNTYINNSLSVNSTSKCKITKCFCKSTPLVLRNSISFLVSH